MKTFDSAHKVAFIGGGNMATAMITGLIAHGVPATNIIVSEPSEEKGELLQQQLGVMTTTHSADAVSHADVIVFAVKPQIIDVVASEFVTKVDYSNRLFVSILAGTTTARISQLLGQNIAIARLMPNLPASKQCGVSGLLINKHVTDEQRGFAQVIAASCDEYVELSDEQDIDKVTALSGSGPAYFLLLMEAMVEQGVALGLSEEDAKKLTLNTAMGTSVIAADSDLSLAQLRQQIMSPKGTTESAVNHLVAAEFPAIVRGAVKAAHQRAVELGIKSAQE